jgi:hypothetical protein
MDELTSSLIQQMPVPDPQLVGADPAQNPQYAHLRDRRGRGFDARIHRVNPDGSPRLNRDGKVAIKPLASKPVEPSLDADNDDGPDGDGVDYGAAGRALADLFLTVVVLSATAVGGPEMGAEWAASEGERAALTDASVRCAEAYGLIEIPPWVLLMGAVVGYAAPRLFKPVTQARIAEYRRQSREQARQARDTRIPGAPTQFNGGVHGSRVVTE